VDQNTENLLHVLKVEISTPNEHLVSLDGKVLPSPYTNFWYQSPLLAHYSPQGTVEDFIFQEMRFRSRRRGRGKERLVSNSKLLEEMRNLEA